MDAYSWLWTSTVAPETFWTVLGICLVVSLLLVSIRPTKKLHMRTRIYHIPPPAPRRPVDAAARRVRRVAANR